MFHVKHFFIIDVYVIYLTLYDICNASVYITVTFISHVVLDIVSRSQLFIFNTQDI